MQDRNKTKKELLRELEALRECLKIPEGSERPAARAEAQRGATERSPETESQFRSMFEANPLPMLVYDREALSLLAVNDAAVNHYGYSREEFLSMTIKDIRPPEDVPLLLDRLSKKRERLNRSDIRRHKKKDGTVIDVEITAHDIFFGGRHARLVLANDVTEQKRAENILAARVRLMQYAASHSLVELLQATLDEVEALTGSVIGFFHFVEADQKTVCLQAWSTRTIRDMCRAQSDVRHYDLEQAGVWVDCVRMRCPVVHNDYPALPHRKGLPPGHAPVVRELVVPILRGDTIVGILGVGNKPHDYTRHDIETVSLLADVAWDIAERKQMEEKLRHAAEEWQTTFDSIQDLIMLLDRDFRIVRVNSATLSLFHLPPDQLIGNYCYTLMHETKTPVEGCPVQKAIQTKVHEEAEIYHERKHAWFSVSADPILDGQGEITGVVHRVKDITDRKRVEQALLSRFALEKLLSAVSACFISVPSEEIDRATDDALRLIGTHASADRCYIFQFSGDGTTMSNTHEWCAEGIHPQKGRLQGLPTKLFPWWMERLKRFETIRVPRVADLPPEAEAERAILEAQNIRFLDVVPLISDTSLVGFFGLDFVRKDKRWNEADIVLLKTTGNIFAGALERRRAHHHLYKASRALKALSACHEAMVRAAGEQELLDEICRIVVDVGGYRLCWVGYKEHDEGKTVKPMAQAGYEEGYLKTVNVTWADRERGRGPVGTASRTGRPSVFSSVVTNPDFTPWREDALKRGYASVIGLPLKADSDTFGALAIYAAEPDAFDDEEVRLLKKLSDSLAYGVVALRTRADTRRTEVALRESEKRFRAIYEQAPLGIAVIDSRTGQFLQINPRYCEIVGRTQEEMLRLDFQSITHPDDLQADLDNMARLIDGKSRFFNMEKRYFRPDGSIVWVILTVVPMWGAGESPRCHIAMVDDITLRKRAEEALRESRRMLQLVLDTIPARVFWKDRNSMYLGCNRLFCEDAGLSSPAEILGKNDFELPWRNQAALYRADDQTVVEHDSPKLAYEELQSTPDGRCVWVRTSKVPLRNERGKVIGVLGTYEDITERKLADDKQAQLIVELESVNRELDEFAYIISHDLKAPLRAIASLADWIATDYADSFDQQGREKMDLLMSRVKRLHDLIDAVLQYSRAGRAKEQVEEINLREVVPNIIDMLFSAKNISILIENELPTIKGERTRVEQVFQNLLSNAITFMDKPKGQIRIGCVPEGSYWKFSVADNGPGIEEKYFNKIFQIFQTIQPENDRQSTGVGLALVKKIVEMYGGTVWVESKVGVGSTFYFTLPKRI